MRGGKGALSGILESTVEAMEKLGANQAASSPPSAPLIRQSQLRSGGEFVERFVQTDAENTLFFIPSRARPRDVRSGRLHPDALENAGVLMIDDIGSIPIPTSASTATAARRPGRAGLWPSCSRDRAGKRMTPICRSGSSNTGLSKPYAGMIL